MIAAVEAHHRAIQSLDHIRIMQAAEMIAECLSQGGKVMFCGNGGSAADAQHFASELIGRFRNDRPPKAAVALTVDSSALTCIGNDYGFEEIFARQLRGIGKTGDILVAISTSGMSENVLRAGVTARTMGIKVIGLCGKAGLLPQISNICIQVDSDSTARIQEAHILVCHLVCELLDA